MALVLSAPAAGATGGSVWLALAHWPGGPAAANVPPGFHLAQFSPVVPDKEVSR
jgi:hypothetical protein